ncbi:hypothetical protein IGI04_026238 [Brassica rapa subsp. trilocularis]|uniref:Uncharacterized protein n=1 Tax=Brassica rapa subsp. trilocularis TaxID=1813537 RepID=A0ABQ7KZC5_BRACM|nr:hypothetical protein IGI04_026238 [Brassica rapa subsp. trilocularis]
MYIWYAPDSSCLPNIFFITWTLFLIQLMTCIALHPKVSLDSCVMVLNQWEKTATEKQQLQTERTGLQSDESSCNWDLYANQRSVSALEASSERFLSGFEGPWLALGFVVALLAMVIATFSTGIDSQCFRFKKDVCSEGEDQEDGVPYMDMDSSILWMIDVGWTSTWVRIVNEWVAVCVYS